jgi:hypothetical protein
LSRAVEIPLGEKGGSHYTRHAPFSQPRNSSNPSKAPVRFRAGLGFRRPDESIIEAYHGPDFGDTASFFKQLLSVRLILYRICGILKSFMLAHDHFSKRHIDAVQRNAQHRQLANPNLLEKMGNAAVLPNWARYTWPKVVADC